MKPPAPVTTIGAEVDGAVSDGQTLQFSMAEDCIFAPGRPRWAPHGFWVFTGRARAFVPAGLSMACARSCGWAAPVCRPGAGIRFGGVFRHCAGARGGVRGWAIWGIVRHIPECVLAGLRAGKSQVLGRAPSRREPCGTGHVPGRKQQNNTSQEVANFP